MTIKAVFLGVLRGGVYVEQIGHLNPKPHPHDVRCFRFDHLGNAEWAFYGDLVSTNPAPRWYGTQFTKKDFQIS